MEELPTNITWGGKRATLAIERTRPGHWEAYYYYKRWPSKNGGHNADIVTCRLASTEIVVKRKMLKWWLSVRDSGQAQSRQDKRKAERQKKSAVVAPKGQIKLEDYWAK